MLESRLTDVTVTLEGTELVAGGVYGVMRRVSAIQRKRQPRYGEPDSRELWDIDINAVLSEMALAKHLDEYYEPLMPNGKVDSAKADVGRFHQARSIRDADHRLILHRDDVDDCRYYLIYCQAPTFTLLGWIYGADGKRDEWWETFTGRPAYFVPQHALTPCNPF